MPNPEQNKSLDSAIDNLKKAIDCSEQNKLEKFEKLWNEEMEVIRTKNYPPNFNYMHDLCLRIVSQTHQQTIEEAIKIILENSHEKYTNCEAFLQTNTDKVILRLKERLK